MGFSYPIGRGVSRRAKAGKTRSLRSRLLGSSLRGEPLESRCLLSVQPFPTPFVEVSPAGSQVYDKATSDTITSVGDSDTFTLTLDPGQSLSVTVDGYNGLQPMVQISGPGISASGSASAPEGIAIVQGTPNAGGAFTITVSGVGSTTGGYDIRAILNASLEEENFNNTEATAQNIDAAFRTSFASMQLTAVQGTTIPGDFDYYAFNLNANESISLLAAGLSSGITNLRIYKSGDVLETGTYSSTTGLTSIDRYVAPTAGVYYARVVNGTDYTVAFAKNASLNRASGENSSNGQNVFLSANTGVAGAYG